MSAWQLTAVLLVAAGIGLGCNRTGSDAAGGAASAAPGAGSGVSGSAASGSSGASSAAGKPLVEQREDGSLAWTIRPDGSVTVKIRDAEGKAVAPADLEGTLTVREAATPMWAEGDGLGGAIGKLDDELTDVGYSVKVKGKEWSGMLQVPSEGTAALAAEPKVSVPPGTVGPNGGVVDVVGDQRVELVADSESGELRVYLLDDKLQVMPVGDAEITVGIVE
jgi:hypothetical protein